MAEAHEDAENAGVTQRCRALLCGDVTIVTTQHPRVRAILRLEHTPQLPPTIGACGDADAES